MLLSYHGNEVTLWHLSTGDQASLKQEGLCPDYWKVCVGGQQKGSYFFTRKVFASSWYFSNFNYYQTFNNRVILTSATFNESDIRYPDWRLDLFFNQQIIPLITNRIYKLPNVTVRKNGHTELNLPSQIAFHHKVGKDEFFTQKAVNIKSIFPHNKKHIYLFPFQQQLKQNALY